MKCPYLFLVVVTFCTLMTCEAQRSNNDIIWYPVDDEEGVFVSVYGEKRRDAPESKWRSHRRARYSGMDRNPVQALPLSYDPTENQDFSFFHNINERRPDIVWSDNQKNPPFGKPAEGNENNLQEIFNEVFDNNKYPSGGSQIPGSSIQYVEDKPENQWGNTQSYPGSRPGNQWNGNVGFPGQRPWGTSDTFDQWGTFRPVTKPNEWLTTTGGTKRPNKRPGRPVGSDVLVFPEETTRNVDRTSRLTTTTPSNLLPTDPPTMSPCERSCPVTPEFNPVCGSDSQTYTNAGRLKCAQMCGKGVKLSHYGNCGRTPFVTPLVSNNPTKTLRQFWFF